MDSNIFILLTISVLGAALVAGGIVGYRRFDRLSIKLLSMAAIVCGASTVTLVLAGFLADGNTNTQPDPKLTPVVAVSTPTTEPTPTAAAAPTAEESASRPKSILISSRPRETTPDVTQPELANLVEGNSEFAFDLYQALRDGDGNLFFSPFSISQALAMTYAGARGQTEQEMADTLHYDLSQDRLHPAFNSLDLELAKRDKSIPLQDRNLPEIEYDAIDEGFRLSIINSIWGQEDYPFLDEFLDLLAEHYGAGMNLVSFIRETEAARIIINQWVNDQTHGRIQDLFPPGSFDEMTRLALVNAIYFNAAWQHPFNESNTSESIFHLIDNGQVTVPMMHQTESFPYVDEDGYFAVDLPYVGNELSMMILVPDEGQFAAMEEALDARIIAAIDQDLESTHLDLTMPKFEFSSDFDLEPTLTNMGMPTAFEPGEADFSGMDGDRKLYISTVVHRAFVAVDEEGTEAAAATGVGIEYMSAPPPPIEVTIDRPFILLIRDIETGSILFAGRVMNPSMASAT